MQSNSKLGLPHAFASQLGQVYLILFFFLGWSRGVNPPAPSTVSPSLIKAAKKDKSVVAGCLGEIVILNKAGDRVISIEVDE